MTDKRTLTFSDRQFDYDMWEGVTFWGQEGTTRVRCRISREALSDHFSEGDRLRPNVAFEKHRDEIEALARRKYLQGELQPDKSILIGTTEIYAPSTAPISHSQIVFIRAVGNRGGASFQLRSGRGLL